MISNEIIEEVTVRLLEDSFYNYFKKPKKETKHIILDRLFPEERRVSSAMSGLQTSLGSFWEKLSIELAKLNDFEVLSPSLLKRPRQTNAQLQQIIIEVKLARETSGGNLDNLRQRLNKAFQLGNQPDEVFLPMISGKGVDLIFRKNDKVHIFDVKTVQINAGFGNTSNENVILWSSYYKYQYGVDAENVFAKLIFPYNSSDENDDAGWWTEFGSRIAPLTKADIMVGNQYWSFLTDNPNALILISAAIDSLINKDFSGFYRNVFECESQDDLNQFAIEAKVHRIKQKRNIDLDPQRPDQDINARRNISWVHGNGCVFSARLNRLADDEAPLQCPTCNLHI